MWSSRKSGGAVLLAAVAGALVLLGGAAGAGTAEACGTSGPLVCLSVSGTPDVVPPSEAGSPHYVSYGVEVANRARSTVTHVAVTVIPSGGLELVSAAPSAGSCTTTASRASCTIGSVAAGGAVTVDVVARAPAAEGTVGASFTASYDEGVNDGPKPDPKQDTVTTTLETTVALVSGSASSFVPEGASVELSTDPTDTGTATAGDPLIADAAITSAPAPLTALLEEVPGPLRCPKGVVCRRGDWVHASIPGTFDPPLSFTLRWDKSLVPSNLNAKKFALLVTECLDGCPLEVISARCSSAAPGASELPCLWNVARLQDGDWRATLVNDHNGYMH
jgi:hypothetical protein